MTIAPARRCEFCGYDLRGITSEQCPECGNAKSIALRFDDHEQYHRARVALEHAGLLVSFVNAGGVSEIVHGTSKSAGWLRVSSLHEEQVADILQNLGVRWVEESRVFVDQLDATCPRCGGDLPIVGVDTCATCGVGLKWGEQPDALESDAEIVCPTCFRDVRLVDGQCPLCSTKARNAPSEADSNVHSIPARISTRRHLGIWLCLTIGLCIPLIVLTNTLLVMSNNHTPFLSFFIAAPVSAIIAAHFASRRR